MITCLSLATILATQIPDFGGRDQAEKMKALSFLEGSWEGTAAYYRGDQVIPIHDAAAMITYDQTAQKYLMTAQLANGMKNTFELKVGKNSYKWEIPAEIGGQKTEYEMVITSKGEWNEVGYTVVGDKRTKLMEMNLAKKSK